MKNVVVKVDRSRINRKVVFSFIVFAVAITSLTSFVISAMSTNTLENGLVGYWRFDEGGGPILNDSAETNPGNIYGARWVDGKFGEALYFDGSGDYVRANVALSSQQMTACGWVKQIGSWSEKKGFVQGNGYNLHLWATQNGKFSYGAWTTSTNEETVSTNVHDFSEWTFACVVNKGADYSKLYVNGKFDEQRSLAGNLRDITYFEFGRHPNYNGNWMLGSIDEVRIYNRTLSAAEIRALYNKGAAKFSTHYVNASGKVLHIDFDHKNTTYLYDVSGTGNDATITGATQKNANYCKVGRCFEFDGDDYVLTNSIDYTSSSTGTLMGWVKSDPITADMDFFGWRKVGGYDDYTNFMIDDPTGQVRFYWDDGPTERSIQGDVDVTNSEWHHVAVTQDGTTVKMYVDGIVQSDTETTSMWWQDMTYSTQSVWIGDAFNTLNYFTGHIDEVKIYDRALSQKEIIEEAGLDALYEGGAVLYMPFDEGGGNVAWDVSVHNNTGSIEPGAGNMPEWVDGVIGSALRFDGIDDHIDVVFDASNDIDGLSAYSVMGWVKYPTGSTHQDAFITKHWPDMSLGANNAGPSTRKAKFRLAINTAGTGDNNAATGTTTLLDNTWYHLAGTYDGTNMVLYVNGNVDKILPASGSITTGSDYAYMIGANDYGGYDNAVQDEIRVFHYTLTEEEVRRYYSEGVGRIKAYREPQDPGRDGLVADIDFDYKNSTHVFDRSSEENHGIISGALENTSAACKEGRCMLFDGSNDYVDAIDALNSNRGAISMWIKPDVTASERTSHEYVFTNGVGEGGTNSYHLRARACCGSPNDLIFYIYASGTSSWQGRGTEWNTNDWVAGNWYHVVAVWDTTSGGSFKIYNNGTEVATGSASNPGDPLMPTKLSIGSKSGAESFNGMIDEVRYYNRTLSPEEIWYLYNRGGPAGEWRMNEGTGSTAYDTSVKSNDGTITGATWVTNDTCISGNCLGFNTSGDYVTLGSDASLDVADQNHTLCAWFKTTGTEEDIISSGTGAGNYLMMAYQSTGRLRGHVWTDSSSNTIDSNAIVNDGIWHHGCQVVDDTKIYVYVDGEMDKSQALVGTKTGTAGTVYIGCRSPGSTSAHFAGFIDEAKIYPYALTADQIKREYNRGALSVGI